VYADRIQKFFKANPNLTATVFTERNPCTGPDGGCQVFLQHVLPVDKYNISFLINSTGDQKKDADDLKNKHEWQTMEDVQKELEEEQRIEHGYISSAEISKEKRELLAKEELKQPAPLPFSMFQRDKEQQPSCAALAGGAPGHVPQAKRNPQIDQQINPIQKSSSEKSINKFF
jgi:hypothetical protein